MISRMNRAPWAARRRAFSIALLASSTLLPLSTTAMAQATSAQPGSAPSTRFEEIVVTAQRRTERLENVPMSVSVASAEVMERSGALGVHDLGSVVPAMQINFNGLNTMVSVRGVGNNANGTTVENNVSLYIDGLYQSDAIAVNMDLPNIESVQVLKGPQGTLYGRNATGGTILVKTKAPSKVWTGSFAAGYAEFNEKTFSGFLSGPISNTVRFSLAGYNRSGDGYLVLSDRVTGLRSDTPAAPQRNQTVNTKIEADIGDNFTATLGWLYSLTADARSNQFTPFAYFPPTLAAPPLRPVEQHPDVKAYQDGVKLLDFGNEVSLNLAWRTGIGELTSTTGFAKRNMKGGLDADGTYLNQALTAFKYVQETWQSTLNYNITLIDNLNLSVGGVYYHDDRYSPYNSLTFTNGALSSRVFNHVIRKAWQIYIDGTYNITDTLSLTVGGGYAHERSRLTYAAQNGAGVQVTPPTVANATFKKFTPRAALRYEFAPQTSLYASYAQGFKAGMFVQNLPPDSRFPVRQETIEAYEIGIKTVQQDFRAELAGFYYDYKDLQVSALIPDPLCTLPPAQCSIRQIITNGPKAEIYGVDGQVTWTPTEQLAIRFGAAWLHTKFVSFANSVGVGLSATNTNIAAQQQDWSGLPLQRAPKFSGNVGVDYNVPTSFGGLLFSVSTKFTTGYIPGNGSVFGPLAPADLRRKLRYYQDGYAIVNARITWTDPSEHFSVEAFVRNLTDKRYFINYTGAARGDYGTYAAPRTFGGLAKYKF